MTTYAVLLVGLALAGDGRPPDVSKVYKVYPVADLVVPVNKDREQAFLRLIQEAEKDYVPFPETEEKHYLQKLLQLERDRIPFPESDLIVPPSPDQIDPVLGYYPPSKALVE